MKPQFYFFFTFYTLLFLFYPGGSHYFNRFAFGRSTFADSRVKSTYTLRPVPYLRIPYNVPQTTAEGIYIVDLPTFTPIFEQMAKGRFFPASTTKIITALVTYDIYNPDDVVTIKEIKEDGQVMGLVSGERITVENLLYGMLVHSGNDAAYVLASNYGYERFIDLMNLKARNLGMSMSHFNNPSGLDEFDNYTTPYDLALAARELLKNKYLSKIVSTRDITVSDTDFKYFHKLTNINKLLGEVAGLGGLKTGYTENAGENLVSYFKENGHDFIIVVLKSEDRFQDTRNIIDWIRTNVDYIQI